MYESGAEIISTANSRKNILEKKQANAPAGMAPARIVFTDETSVFLGARKCERISTGAGTLTGMRWFISRC